MVFLRVRETGIGPCPFRPAQNRGQSCGSPVAPAVRVDLLQERQLGRSVGEGLCVGRVRAGEEGGFEAGDAGRQKVDALARAGQAPWAETLRQAKALGEVDIEACSLSMDLLGLEESDLDPLVDGVEGVTAFYLNAGDGQIVFV